MVVLVVIAALLAIPAAAGWIMAVIDPPPASWAPGRAPPRAFPGVDTEGRSSRMEPAPRRLANWLFSSKSITGAP